MIISTMIRSVKVYRVYRFHRNPSGRLKVKDKVATLKNSLLVESANSTVVFSEVPRYIHTKFGVNRLNYFFSTQKLYPILDNVLSKYYAENGLKDYFI